MKPWRAVQCMRDGKSMIMEGVHLDPGLYMAEFGKYGLIHAPPSPGRRGCGFPFSLGFRV